MTVVSAERAQLGYGLGTEEGEAFWLLGMLETIKIGGEDTAGQYGLIEIVVREGEGSPWHVHPDEDEWFEDDGIEPDFPERSDDPERVVWAGQDSREWTILPLLRPEVIEGTGVVGQPVARRIQVGPTVLAQLANSDESDQIQVDHRGKNQSEGLTR